MATDYVTSPVTPTGRFYIRGSEWNYNVANKGVGRIYPEGVTYAILFMNLVTPLIDKVCSAKNYYGYMHDNSGQKSCCRRWN